MTLFTLNSKITLIKKKFSADNNEKKITKKNFIHNYFSLKLLT
jgi:hypothetical protein